MWARFCSHLIPSSTGTRFDAPMIQTPPSFHVAMSLGAAASALTSLLGLDFLNWSLPSAVSLGLPSESRSASRRFTSSMFGWSSVSVLYSSSKMYRSPIFLSYATRRNTKGSCMYPQSMPFLIHLNPLTACWSHWKSST